MSVSIYRWQGAVERADEALIILKTTEFCVDRLRERAAALRPHEVPEVLALAVADGHEPYLDWVRRESGSAGL